jgi:hypothetical protein
MINTEFLMSKNIDLLAKHILVPLRLLIAGLLLVSREYVVYIWETRKLLRLP